MVVLTLLDEDEFDGKRKLSTVRALINMQEIPFWRVDLVVLGGNSLYPN